MPFTNDDVVTLLQSCERTSLSSGTMEPPFCSSVYTCGESAHFLNTPLGSLYFTNLVTFLQFCCVGWVFRPSSAAITTQKHVSSHTPHLLQTLPFQFTMASSADTKDAALKKLSEAGSFPTDGTVGGSGNLKRKGRGGRTTDITISYTALVLRHPQTTWQSTQTTMLAAGRTTPSLLERKCAAVSRAPLALVCCADTRRAPSRYNTHKHTHTNFVSIQGSCCVGGIARTCGCPLPHLLPSSLPSPPPHSLIPSTPDTRASPL